MYDLLVVGAGPAGLSAAIAASEEGLDVKIVDEFPKAGGRLLGQLHQEPDGEWWNGIEVGDELTQKALNLGVELHNEVSVYDISRVVNGWKIHTSAGVMYALKLLLATGATEHPIPIPGWTLPGVISIGAAQVMSNVHRVKPGDSCVIIGANVLSIAIANELRLCGINVKEIIIPAKSSVSDKAGDPEKVLKSLMTLTHLAPTAFMRQLGKLGKLVSPSFAVKWFPKKGIKIFGIPIRIKTAATEIIGEEHATGVKSAHVNSKGEVLRQTEKVEEADFVCIAGGLAPLTELAFIAGCSFKYQKELGGYVPVHNEHMETNVSDLYVAGNITGVESAKVAIAQGKVAGKTIAFRLKDLIDTDKEIEKAMEEVKETRENALIQFQPNIKESREEVYSEFESEQENNRISLISKKTS